MEARRIIEIADEMRAIGENGLHWSRNEYDTARYDRLMSLGAELMSQVDSREADEIERIFRGDLSIRTPFVGVDAAVFDEQGRILLIERSDSRRWAMPGGAAEVGDTPATVAVRETREETGLEVEATRLVGVYDSRLVGTIHPVHLYHLVFLCRPVGGELHPTTEALQCRYFAREEASRLPLHPGHDIRIADAFKVYRGEVQDSVFQ